MANRTPDWMYSVRDDNHADHLAEADAEAAVAMQKILGLLKPPSDAFAFFQANLAAINRAVWSHLTRVGRHIKQPPARQQTPNNQGDRLVILDHTNCFLFYCSSVGVPKTKLFALPDLSQGKNPLAVLSCIAALERQLSLIAPIIPISATQQQTTPSPPVAQAPKEPAGGALTKVMSSEKKTPVSAGYDAAEESPASSPRKPPANVSNGAHVPPAAVKPAPLKPSAVASYGDHVSPDVSPERARPVPAAASPQHRSTPEPREPISSPAHASTPLPAPTPARSAASSMSSLEASSRTVPKFKPAISAGYADDVSSPPSSPDHPILRTKPSAIIPVKTAAKPPAAANYEGDDVTPPTSPGRIPQSAAMAATTAPLSAPVPVPAKPAPKPAVAGYGHVDDDSPPSSPDRPIIRNSGTKSSNPTPVPPKPSAAAVAGYGHADNSPPSSPDRPIFRNSGSKPAPPHSSKASAAAGYGAAEEYSPRSAPSSQAPAPTKANATNQDTTAKAKSAAVAGYGHADDSPPSSPDRPIIRNSGTKPSTPAPAKSAPKPKSAAVAGYGHADDDSPPSSPDRPIIRNSGTKPSRASLGYPEEARDQSQKNLTSSLGYPQEPRSVDQSQKSSTSSAAMYGDDNSPPSSPDRPIIRNSTKVAAQKKKKIAAASYGDQESPPSSPDRPIIRNSSSSNQSQQMRATKEQLLQSAASYGVAASPPHSADRLAMKQAQFGSSAPKILDAGYRDVDDAPVAPIQVRPAPRPIGRANLPFPDPIALEKVRNAYQRPHVSIHVAPTPLALAQGHYGQRLFHAITGQQRAPQADMLELENCLHGFLCSGSANVTAEDFGSFASFFGPAYRQGRDFIDNVFELLSKQWLHPTTDNEVVNRLLQNERPGTFLVRMSRERGSFVVCVRYPADVKQFKVPRTNEGFRLADGVSAQTIQDLVALLRAQPLVYPLPRTRYLVNAPVASGIELVKVESLANKAARAVAESWWRYPGAARFLFPEAQALLGKVITTHYLHRAQFLLEHFAFSSAEQLTWLLRDNRLVSWWLENSAKCANENDVNIPALAALVATSFGIPYKDLCVLLTAVLNDFAGTSSAAAPVYNVNITHLARFHLTFSSPTDWWPAWYAELRALLMQPWFFGTLTTADAATLLANQPVGTFLIRFSAPPGALAIGSVTASGVVKHYKVVHEPGKPYNLGEKSDYGSIDELLVAAERACFCKVPLNAPRKFRLWLATTPPEPPARILPPPVSGDYLREQPAALAKPPRMQPSNPEYQHVSMYGTESGISQSPPPGEEKKMYHDAPQAKKKKKITTSGNKPLKSGYGDADSGNDSSPWEEDPDASLANQPLPVPQQDSGAESSPWDDDDVIGAVPKRTPSKPPASDYVKAAQQPPTGDYVRGTITSGPTSDYVKVAQQPPQGDYVRAAQQPPPGDYVRAAQQPPAGDYVRAAQQPQGDYVRPATNKPPAPSTPVPSGYGHADSDDVLPAISLPVDGRGPSPLGGPPAINYPHSDEDRSSPHQRQPHFVPGQQFLTTPNNHNKR